MDNQIPSLAKIPYVPTDDAKAQIIETVWNNKVTIIAGEPGSGKTSRIPLYLHEAGFSADGLIGVTEPRRIVVREMAHYVSGLLGEQVGKTIGYRVRFSDYLSVHTRIKYLTDGMLLAELCRDKLLSEYAVIMIDEAHERSVILDLLLALLKRMLTMRPDLKVIVSSATINEQAFSDFFDGAPIINVSGRMYPVAVSYLSEESQHPNKITPIVRKVANIHRSGETGDILVFVTGTNEIYAIIRELETLALSGIVYFPVHATLDFAEQQRIFQAYPGMRKVIIATNIAETGITINTKLHVIDSGYVKQNRYNPMTGALSLHSVKHSKAGCNQRMGRAGRMADGICHRMYTKEDFESRSQSHNPDILRSDLAEAVLKLEFLGISDIDSISFLDPPKVHHLVDAYETLFAIGALHRDDEGLPAGLTPDGKVMARLPLHPAVSRMILDAQQHGCVEEFVTVASFMMHEGRFLAVHHRSEEDMRAIETGFNNPQSDALKLLEIWSAYIANGQSSIWCRSNFLQETTMMEIGKTRHQILDILSDFDVVASSSLNHEVICKAFAHGMIRNLFIHDKGGMFNGVLRKNCRNLRIHPYSGLFSNTLPPGLLIVASNIYQSKTLTTRICSRVQPEWLCEFDPKSFSMDDTIVFGKNEGKFAVFMRRELRYESSVFHSTSYPLTEQEARSMFGDIIQKATDEGLECLTFKPSKSRNNYIASLPDSTIVRRKSIEPGIYLCRVRRSNSHVFADPVYRMDTYMETDSTIL